MRNVDKMTTSWLVIDLTLTGGGFSGFALLTSVSIDGFFVPIPMANNVFSFSVNCVGLGLEDSTADNMTFSDIRSSADLSVSDNISS